MKLVVIEGRECLVTDGVTVVGDAWICENGADRLLCGKELSSFHLYKEIPIRDFIYAKEVSFGRHVVEGEKRLEELLELYKEYWGGGGGKLRCQCKVEGV